MTPGLMLGCWNSWRFVLPHSRMPRGLQDMVQAGPTRSLIGALQAVKQIPNNYNYSRMFTVL